VLGFFKRVSETICPGWFWTMMLLISASWIARITGMSHQCLARENGNLEIVWFCLSPRPRLTWNLLCSTGWPRTPSAPALASRMPGLQVCTSMPGLYFPPPSLQALIFFMFTYDWLTTITIFNPYFLYSIPHDSCLWFDLSLPPLKLWH
jgi:hypothetical protein